MILILIIGVLTAAFVGFILYLLMAYILPARSGPGHYFIDAKKKGVPVIALDDGGRWIFMLGDNKFTEDFIQDKKENVVNITPNSLKYAPGGVLFGVGDYYRAITANAGIVDLLRGVIKEQFDVKDIRAAIKKIEEAKKTKGGGNV